MTTERGLLLSLPPVQPRSRKAFETAFFERESGRFDAVHRAIFKAFFEDGIDIGDIDALLDIAATCGIDPESLEEALLGDELTDAVIEDEEFATKLGVTSVPCRAVAGRSGRPGTAAAHRVARRGSHSALRVGSRTLVPGWVSGRLRVDSGHFLGSNQDTVPVATS